MAKRGLNDSVLALPCPGDSFQRRTAGDTDLDLERDGGVRAERGGGDLGDLGGGDREAGERLAATRDLGAE